MLRPDGIPVELLHGSQVVARTTTVRGTYRFSGLRPGDYVARSRVIGDIGDQTSSLIIAVADVEAADTLRVASRGDLLPVPNPLVDTLPRRHAVFWNGRDQSGHPVTDSLLLDHLRGRQQHARAPAVQATAVTWSP